MSRVDVYLRVRRAVMVEGMSIREAARVFGLHRDTVRKMLAYSMPPGYRRQVQPWRPKLEPFTGVIDRILESDHHAPRKRRHTANRIHERLSNEYGFDGGYTTVKDYVRERRCQTREMFVPKSHSPARAQCDFGEALVGHRRGGAEGPLLHLGPAPQRRLFHQGLSRGDHRGLPGRTRLCLRVLGRSAPSILYENTRLAVARILGDGRRKRTRAFTELQSNYLFEDRFGRPGKGNDKRKVEGIVGYVRRNFLVPIPSFDRYDALNAHLERRCLERMERDLDALLPLPPVPYDACDKQAAG